MQDRGGTGSITEDQLRDVLFRNNLNMEDKHFETLMFKMDSDGDGTVSYSEFLKYFGKGSQV